MTLYCFVNTNLRGNLQFLSLQTKILNVKVSLNSVASNMENVLTEIHGKFVKLRETEVQRNKEILSLIVDTLVEKLKLKSALFNKLFRRVFYGGSFYDNLRVGEPKEFDLDFLLDLKPYGTPQLIESDNNGFVHLKLEPFGTRRPEPFPPYRDFERLLMEGNYLSTIKVLNWMESIIQLCLNDLTSPGYGFYVLHTQSGPLQLVLHKAYPALLLEVIGAGIEIDIDLVASFVFKNDIWPIGYRSNPYPRTLCEFFIVPKQPKNYHMLSDPQPYWRLSFQEQERELLNRKERLNSSVRLLKKLRDTQGHHSIASYYIKTVFLHLVHEYDFSFWNKPLHQVFMTTLKRYCQFIENQSIPYYWNTNNNLVGNIHPATLVNIAQRLKAIIRDIENNSQKPDTVAKYLLTREEYNEFTGGIYPGQIVLSREPEAYVCSPEPQQNNQSRCTIN